MKSTTKVLYGLGMIAIGAVLFLTACQKEVSGTNNSGNAKQLSLYLTDGPCQFDSVLIDISYVEVKIDTSLAHRDDDHFGDNDNDGDDDHHGHDDFGKWDTLAINPGVYNVLQLRNGIDTLLATGNIPAGKIRKIRLTLGSSNSIVVGGITHALSLFPGTNNYVYVKIHSECEDNISSVHTAVWIDFNVCESIRQVGGLYYLKPFFKPFGLNHFAKIEGRVLPGAAHAFVTASNGTDSATAIPWYNGEYKILGLRQGTYNITFTGSAGYNDTTINNIQVQNGQETHIPRITLHQ